ncbi:hypothetical protein [Bacillus thuringiensis]|uniref:hypothetical protein n=1 Tax=Bacillus thuringiensis TaxID=1428 RepID=UPI000BFE733F|nr:hypothetical protein [Bacillus thuringiensis]PGT89872.1 hypothetical protein COD17_08975 [Bacillus thuringiensis]
MKYKKTVVTVGATLLTTLTVVAGTMGYGYTQKHAVLDKGKEEKAYVVAKEPTKGLWKSYGKLKVDVQGKAYQVPVTESRYKDTNAGDTLVVYEHDNKIVVQK